MRVLRSRPLPARLAVGRWPLPGFGRLAPRPFITANFVTLRLSVVTICSAVVAPMPGSVVSHFASCRLIASAISFTGRAIAFSAFFAPIFSTVQNSSKNSSSASVLKPIRRGTKRLPPELPSRYSVMWNVISCPTRSWMMPAHRFGHQHLILERPDLEPGLVVEHAGQEPVIFVIIAVSSW